MKGKKLIATTLGLSMLLGGCGTSEVNMEEATMETISTPKTAAETTSSETTDDEVTDDTEADKEVIVYFANWNLGSKPAEYGGEVAGIPWENVSYINHAFWTVAPADGSTESSVERRDSGNGARTNFAIVSTSPDADYKDTAKSAIHPELPRNHFAEYAYYSQLYPDVNIMISVGGWTASGYFSEMAYTAEGRQSFIDSCIQLMQEYSWIDGIDIDWEYPGGSKGGERASEGPGDQGCPIFGTAAEDSTNFAALLSELRTAMDQQFGKDTKKLTACASASTGWTLPMQDWASFAPHLDLINIMTYDLSGVWEGVTGNASSLEGTKNAVNYFKKLGIPTDKLCIGSPLYGTPYLIKEINSDKILGAASENYKPDNSNTDEKIMQSFVAEAMETGTPGWHLCHDEKAGAAYLYNDDEASPYYKWFISFESTQSLQAKLDYIHANDLAGIIVWECSQDTEDYAFITQMADNLFTD